MYGSILDFDQDGKISVDDFEKLAVKYLVKTETRYTQIYSELTQKKLENDWKSHKDYLDNLTLMAMAIWEKNKFQILSRKHIK